LLSFFPNQARRFLFTLQPAAQAGMAAIQYGRYPTLASFFSMSSSTVNGLLGF
jgi:hypothetical protein